MIRQVWRTAPPRGRYRQWVDQTLAAEPASPTRFHRVPWRGRVWRRQVLTSQPVVLLLLTLLSVVLFSFNVVAPKYVPLSAVVVILLLGGFFLRVRSIALLYLVVASGVVFTITTSNGEPGWGTLITIALTAILVFLFARSRERLGVQGTLGESMLVDLRDRLRSQGQVPRLPAQWKVETTLRSAYGDSFSGDFLVSSRSNDDTLLEMALVDVSGKGQAAGTRALLLSGAFGGLIGAMPAEEFLSAANAYLLRQRWDEGFATAVHLGLDLVTGRFRLASAGHPPAAHYHAGSGVWEVIRTAHGPVLGIIDGVAYPAHEGRLERGDALLLYTDGLVETPGRDLDLGIDRLMGQAEKLVRRGQFRGGADWIVDGTRTDESDDRALVLLWRE